MVIGEKWRHDSGPEETQPGGVGPSVSHRFAAPIGDVIPGFKRLVLSEVEPVWLLVMSDIRPIHGEAHRTWGSTNLSLWETRECSSRYRGRNWFLGLRRGVLLLEE